MANRLGIELMQIDPETHPERVMVQLPDFEVRAQADLPFASETALAAVLKALEARGAEVNRGSFYEAELDWLCREGLIIQASEEYSYALNMQERVGRKLFDCLFHDLALYAKYDQARRASERIDLELRFSAADTLVGAQPWELLHDDTGFLAGSGGGTLIRYLSFDAPPPRWQPPDKLNALVITSRPTGLVPLRSSELKAIRAERKTGRLEVTALRKPTLAALEDALRSDGVPQVLHFDGHGGFGRRCRKCGKLTESRKALKCANPACAQPLLDGAPEGYLAFEDAHGTPDFVSAQRFADLLRQAQAMSKDGARILLVTLSACRSGVARGGDSVFNGVAQRLIDARIPAVVATQFSIVDTAALNFARSLYRSIVAGDSLRDAVSWGRTTLGSDADAGGDQWYRPVLYLRWRDNAGGHLFEKAGPQVETDAESANARTAQARELDNLSPGVESGKVLIADKATVRGKALSGSVDLDVASEGLQTGGVKTGDVTIGEGSDVEGEVRSGSIRIGPGKQPR